LTRAWRWPPLALIAWPFDQGLPDIGMGAGAALLGGDKELHDELAAAGWSPTLERVPAADPRAGEVARIFDLLRAHAGAVRAAVGRGAFPLVLSGGCISAAATVAGAAGGRPVGVVWLDAHADLDTPADNVSGSMDVQALAIVTGSAWQASAATIPGFRAVAEDDVWLVGARDLADHQRQRLASSAVHRRDAGALGPLASHVYLHVDLDVLDTSVGRANRHAAPGGLSLEEVLATVDATFDAATVVAAALSAYEPPSDRDGAIRAAALRIARRIATRAFEQR
jgi:arginase